MTMRPSIVIGVRRGVTPKGRFPSASLFLSIRTTTKKFGEYIVPKQYQYYTIHKYIISITYKGTKK